MRDTNTITGDVDFEAKLSKLEAFAQSDVLKKAARDAMEHVALAAAAKAPRKTGALELAIKTRPGKTGRGIFSWIAGAASRWFSGKTFYGAFQEFGWKAGARKQSVEAKARRYRLQATRELRANRNLPADAPGQRLAKRGSRFRSIQDRFIRLESTIKAKSEGDGRRQIPGKHFVERAFKEQGEYVLKAFANAAKAGIERELGGK